MSISHCVFSIEYMVQTKEEWWFPSAWKNLTTYPGNLNSVVLQLSPYLSYRFRVIAVNALGQSEPSRATEYYQTGGAGRVYHLYPLETLRSSFDTL